MGVRIRAGDDTYNMELEALHAVYLSAIDVSLLKYPLGMIQHNWLTRVSSQRRFEAKEAYQHALRMGCLWLHWH